MEFHEQLIDKIEIWINEQYWGEEEEVSSSMAETNLTFFDSEPENIDITLEKGSDTYYIFSVTFDLSSNEPYKDDIPFTHTTINIQVDGGISANEEIEYNELNIDYWTIDNDYTVYSHIEREEPGEDFYLDETFTNLQISQDYSFRSDKLTTLSSTILMNLALLGRQYFFRGHADSSWQLQSTAGREELKKHDLTKIRIAFEKYIPQVLAKAYPINQVESLFLMRHHGLPTKILDWSNSPLVALYFSVENQEHDSKDGCIWYFNRRNKTEEEIENILDEKHALKHGFSMLITPYTNQRMINQQSQFTYHHNSNPLYEHDGFSKIIIPAPVKPVMREILKNFGIDKAFIFADLDNICTQIKEDLLN